MKALESTSYLIKHVDIALQKSLILLSDTLIIKDNIAGWRQFLATSNTTGIFGTSCGLIGYIALNPEDLVLQRKVDSENKVT